MTVRNQHPLWRRVVRATGWRLFHWAENNGNSNLERNGELWLLRRIFSWHAMHAAGRPVVVFDAGANRGDYTKVVLSEAERAGCDVAVYMFEPSPTVCAALQSEFAQESRVRVVPAALSNVNGDALLFSGTSGSTQASLMPRSSHQPAVGQQGVKVTALRLGDYLETQGLERVDLLKLDVEGYELAALEGLGARLTPEVVPIIQFEYGGTTLDAGVSLARLFKLLSAAGYGVAKLFPEALELRSYGPGLEHFVYANYVAVGPSWFERL
jgi:FkbM family methyltransferase